MKKKILYIDMDGVLCKYMKKWNEYKEKNPDLEYPQSIVGFYLELEPMEDAIGTFALLCEKYEVHILTRPSYMNLHCYSEKAEWVLKYLGKEAQYNMILAADKSLLKGDYLIDDYTEHGQTEFEGEFIHFGQEKFPNWKSVGEYLL